MTIQIEIPTTCPSCASDLELVNSQLFCRNKDCPAQSTKKVEAFIKKMRIKGLGPASISKLGFVHPLEIYESSLEYYVEVLGEKIGQKIFNEIENSKTTTFATFLSALSIPLVGETLSKKIMLAGVGSLDELVHNLNDLNLGPKVTENIDKWALSEAYLDATDIEEHLLIMSVGISGSEQVHKGNVCITGKLNDFSNRAKAKECLEGYGYTVTTTVSGKTDYLVCEDGSTSSKSKKAESLGIPIVTIDSLIN